MPTTAVTQARNLLTSATSVSDADVAAAQAAVDAAAGQPPAVLDPLKVDLLVAESTDTATKRAYRRAAALT